MTLKAIIFDVDGTLADTEDLHRRAFNETFAALNLPWRWSPRLYGELLKVAGGKERIVAYVAEYQPALLAEVAAGVGAIHAHKTQRYTALVREGALSLRTGVERLVREAEAAGLVVALATTTTRANVEALLDGTFGPDHPFAVIVAGDEVPSKKPAPDVYERVLDELGLDAPSCLAVEDSGNGVRAALAAGVPVIATPCLYTRGDDFTGALAVVSELGMPGRSYEHYAGAGRNDRNVTVEALERWHAGSRPAFAGGGAPMPLHIQA